MSKHALMVVVRENDDDGRSKRGKIEIVRHDVMAVDVRPRFGQKSDAIFKTTTFTSYPHHVQAQKRLRGVCQQRRRARSRHQRDRGVAQARYDAPHVLQAGRAR